MSESIQQQVSNDLVGAWKEKVMQLLHCQIDRSLGHGARVQIRKGLLLPIERLLIHQIVSQAASAVVSSSVSK